MKKIFPDLKVVETEFFEAHQDWEVPIKGFFIIAPKREMESFDDLSDKEAKDFILLLKKLRKAMREVLDIEDVYIFQNEDTEHNFHVWVFPRHGWMEKFGRGIESVRLIMNYAKENMATEENKEEVREAAKKVRDFMKE